MKINTERVVQFEFHLVLSAVERDELAFVLEHFTKNGVGVTTKRFAQDLLTHLTEEQEHALSREQYEA